MTGMVKKVSDTCFGILHEKGDAPFEKMFYRTTDYRKAKAVFLGALMTMGRETGKGYNSARAFKEYLDGVSGVGYMISLSVDIGNYDGVEKACIFFEWIDDWKMYSARLLFCDGDVTSKATPYKAVEFSVNGLDENGKLRNRIIEYKDMTEKAA